MKIVSDYPGGNIIFKGINNEDGCTEILLEQDMRDTDGWWFYWNFRIDSPPEGKVRFSFCGKDVVCPYGAAVSENGEDWHYDTVGYEDGKHFVYNFDNSGKSVYFAFSLPYQVLHFEKFFTSISADKAVEKTTLAVSEHGREIPLLVVGNGRKNVFFTARHHCCESTASYALEGVINALLNERRSLLDRYTFHIVPFMDIDGAENGDQGKNRRPHDHNRDYSDTPIYNSVKAIKAYAKEKKPVIFIDFHSPWKWGGADSRPHIFLTSYEEDNDETEKLFVSTLKGITENASDVRIAYDGYVNYNSEKLNVPPSNCADIFFKNEINSEFSITIETPYSGDFAEPYSPKLLRKWGGDIAEAFYRCFK